VGSRGVVAAEVGQQAGVEGADVVGEEVFVVVGEFLLHGAIEALVSGVHLRASGVGVVVSPVLRAGVGVEGAGELVTVIGQHLLDGRGEHGLHQRGKLRGVVGGRVGDGEGDGEAAVVVDGGEDVAAHPAHKQHDGVERDVLARAFAKTPTPPGAALRSCSCWPLSKRVKPQHTTPARKNRCS